MTKRIAIPGSVLGPNSFGVSKSYLKFIERFGRPVILTPGDCIDPPEVDLVIAPGGADILPTSYGAIPDYHTGSSNPMLEHFDARILPQYIENKVPVFGVCRGFQSLWARYGGRIDQDNGWHDQSTKYPEEQVHELMFTEEFKEYDKLIKKVTSRHHQCADASEPYGIPTELEVIAYAKEGHNQFWKEIVEIFRHRTLPIFGVQFHPEDHDSSDQLSTRIIKEFLNI